MARIQRLLESHSHAERLRITQWVSAAIYNMSAVDSPAGVPVPDPRQLTVEQAIAAAAADVQ